jgi:hypothetical protein
MPAMPPSRVGSPSPTPRTTPPSGQTVASRRWPVVAAAFIALLGGTYGGYEYSHWQPMDAAEVQRRAEEPNRQEEAKRAAEAEEKAAGERARQEAKRIAETTAVLPPSVSKPTINAPDKPRGAFDGNWQIQWYDATGCFDPHASFSLIISNDAISGGGKRPTTGNVDKAGNITFSRPALIVKGATQRYNGRLSGNSGSGRFAAAGRCVGRFAATRQ